MAAHGHVHWNELNTHDAEAAKTFYAEAFGWTYDRMEMGDAPYWICKRDDAVVGGIFTITDPGMRDLPDHWLTFFAVDELDPVLTHARENGATILREPWDIPDIGRIAIVQDPGGAVTGWMTPAATN